MKRPPGSPIEPIIPIISHTAGWAAPMDAWGRPRDFDRRGRRKVKGFGRVRPAARQGRQVSEGTCYRIS